MYGRQPCRPVDITLGLVLHSVMAPTTSKFVQKLRACVQWAHKKAKLFQAREVQCHKLNYDKHSRAAALEVGDMLLVHVTAFKGHHKIQDQWENREYVVETWPFPNVPVYVVSPSDGEGCSLTLDRNYLLHMSPNLEQARDDTPVAGVEQMRTSAPAPSVDSQPTDSEPSRMATHLRTNLLHSDVAHMQHRTNFHGSTTILHCWQKSAHPASWMHGLVCAFACT